MSEKKPNRFLSLLKMKCPNCHVGNMYSNKSVLPLGKMLDMPVHCPHCGQKYELETGFWFGTGYVSYAISVALIAVTATVFGFTYGFSWRDNSIYVFIGVMIGVLVLVQPWVMRYSRVLYLYFFVRYGEGQKF